MTIDFIHSNINREWDIIVPSSYQKVEEVLDYYRLNNNEINILIVDDIDSDGIVSAKITYTKLRKIFPNCKIKVNNQHGLVDLKSCNGYDLIIIVDSSSNLLETYSVLQQKVIIVDHHEYNREQKCPDNVILVNSKDHEELKSISAGMLCYLVFTKYLLHCGIADYSLFDIACMSLYSDIVPVDSYVASCINKLITEKHIYSDLLSTLNIYNEAINMNNLQYNIIPLLNYTRRLGDVSAIKLIYENREDVAINILKENKKTSKILLDIMKQLSNPKEYKNFVFVDISEILNTTCYPIQNFKGVYANQLQSEYKKPAIVGFRTKENKSLFSISVRSNDIDSLSYFSKLCESGGGHLSACGFMLDINKLPLILAGYNTYLDDYQYTQLSDIIRLDNYSKLNDLDLLKISIDNEFRYSNMKPIIVEIDNIRQSDIVNVDEIRREFSIGKHRVKIYTNLPTDKNLKIQLKPILESYKTERYKLIGKFV